MSDAERARWQQLKRQAAERLDPMVRAALRDAAARAWGRGLFRRPWHIEVDLDEATWRAYRYLGSAGPDDHRYVEFGVVCHLDPDGRVVGLGVDNGVNFMGLHDTSEYGLRRGLEFIRRQYAQVRSRAEPAYDHAIRALDGA